MRYDHQLQAKTEIMKEELRVTIRRSSSMDSIKKRYSSQKLREKKEKDDNDKNKH